MEVDGSGGIFYINDDVLMEDMGDEKNGIDREFTDFNNEDTEEISANAWGQSSSWNEQRFM